MDQHERNGSEFRSDGSSRQTWRSHPIRRVHGRVQVHLQSGESQVDAVVVALVVIDVAVVVVIVN